MNRAATFALVLLAGSGAAESKDLLGVYEDALHNDPVIRQADANRLAAREARPQAISALLPQLNGTASVTARPQLRHPAGFRHRPGRPTAIVISAPAVADTTTRQMGA